MVCFAFMPQCIILLLFVQNSSLNSFEFKFELNLFDLIFKRKCKTRHPLLSLSSPVQNLSLPSPSFPFLLHAGPTRSAGPFPAFGPIRLPSPLSATDRRAPPIGVVFLPVLGTDSSRVRPAPDAPLRPSLGAHAKEAGRPHK